MNASVDDIPTNASGSNSGSGGGTSSSGGGTSSSVVDAMMIEQVLKNPNASQKDIARILDYIKDHPDVVDNKTVAALKERQTSTLGGNDRSADENDPARQQPKPEEPEKARPIERTVTSEDIIAAAKDKASFESFSRGGNAFENADAAQAAGNSLALKTSGELREMGGVSSVASQLDSALAASGINFGNLRGLLSGQVESSRAENVAPSNQQGVDVAASTGVAPPR